MGGSYSDIKTNLSQVGLDWDWPTGLSLAKLFNDIGLQSSGPDASFDTHFAISRPDKSQMAFASKMAFLAFLT